MATFNTSLLSKANNLLSAIAQIKAQEEGQKH
jgi:hypothetical protein